MVAEYSEGELELDIAEIRKEYLNYLTAQLKQLKDLHKAVADALAVQLLSNTTQDTIPPEQLKQVLQTVELQIQQLNQGISKIVYETTETAIELAVFGLISTLQGGLPDDLQMYKTQLLSDGSLFVNRAKDAYLNYLEEDGLTISSRLWRTEKQNIGWIKRIVIAQVSQGAKRSKIAKALRRLLTRTGEKNAWFNSWRLLTNEANKAYIMAFEDYLDKTPWIEKVKYSLSASHPKRDICDTFAEGGENGDGVYDKGEAPIPVFDTHILCQCYTTPVLPTEDKLKAILGLI